MTNSANENAHIIFIQQFWAIIVITIRLWTPLFCARVDYLVIPCYSVSISCHFLSCSASLEKLIAELKENIQKEDDGENEEKFAMTQQTQFVRMFYHSAEWVGLHSEFHFVIVTQCDIIFKWTNLAFILFYCCRLKRKDTHSKSETRIPTNSRLCHVSRKTYDINYINQYKCSLFSLLPFFSFSHALWLKERHWNRSKN